MSNMLTLTIGDISQLLVRVNLPAKLAKISEQEREKQEFDQEFSEAEMRETDTLDATHGAIR